MNKIIILFCFLFQTILVNSQNVDSLKEFTPNSNLDVNSSIRYNRTTIAVPVNDNCSNAVQLTVNGACVTGTTDQATLQIGEYQPTCATLTFNQSVWYRFTATATNMYVQLKLVTIIGGTMSSGRWVSAVYNTSSCLPTSSSLISCQTENSVGTSDGIIENILNNLTIGNSYLIQVSCGVGNGFNGTPQFCINVGDQFTPVCNTCQSPCGQACGFQTTPSISQVVTTCAPFQQMPYNEGGTLVNQCYTFQAVNTTVSFNIIVSSTCGTGNVTNFSYNLYSSNCGVPIQTGGLSNLSFAGLNVGQWYTFCYNFNVPSGCYHVSYYPYFIGVAPLPVELVEFNGTCNSNQINLKWSTASEINNDHFTIYKSKDGIIYLPIRNVYGNGTRSQMSHYEFTDTDYNGGIMYYKLVQFDYDGMSKEYDPIVFDCESKVEKITEVDILGRKIQSNYDGYKIRYK